MPNLDQAPDPQPESGWTAVSWPGDVWSKGPSFITGGEGGNRLRVVYYVREDRTTLVAKAWFGRGAQGPPGYAHGGSMAAVLDEAMGMCGWANGHAVVAKTLTTQFMTMLPLGTDATIEAVIAEVDGNVIMTKGKLFHPETKTVYAEAEGVFKALPIERFYAMLDANTDE